MTDGNQQDSPPEAPEGKPGASPLPDRRVTGGKDNRIGHASPSNSPPTGDTGATGEKPAAPLPIGPKAVWRRELKKPEVEEIPEAPASQWPPEVSHDYGYLSFDEERDGDSRRGARGLSPAVEQRRRQKLVSLLGATQGVQRLPDTNQIVFSCPVCHGRIQCDVTELGKERVCASCRSEYKLPDQQHGGQIVLLRLDPLRGQADELPAAILPHERGADGRSSEVVFQALEEVDADGQEVVVEWGLEKFETKPESSKFKWISAMVAVLVFVCAAGFLIRHVQLSSGRTNATAESNGGGQWAGRVEGGAVDWANIPPGRLFIMVDATIRSYFSAPELAAKAALSRGGEKTLARMQRHYAAHGGYEAETRAYGDVRSIQILEERVLGGRKFLMIRVRFERGNTGVLAVLKAKDRLEVDWDYAVGYGEMDFEKLLTERPAHAVLLRAYLRQASDFSEGFTSAGYRNFSLSDPSRGFKVPVYVVLGSPADSKLRETWGEGEANSSSGRGERHFTLKVHYENSEGRRGFLIDEVLAQGWIVPDAP